MTFCDAHCHLQDPRFGAALGRVFEECRAAGLGRWMVNATREADWAAVEELCRKQPGVEASFGLHPWWQKERSGRWMERLEEVLRARPGAGIGETGLDRWMAEHDLPDQLGVLEEHLRLSRELDRPVTLHCLRAWPELAGALRRTPPSGRGFLLHSYGGPPDMLSQWVRAGAYFSFSPGFLHPRKARVRAMFREVPLERLLVESDAPDMAPPAELALAQVAGAGAESGMWNHPLNLRLCVEALAEDRGLEVSELASVLEENFRRLFLGEAHRSPGV